MQLGLNLTDREPQPHEIGRSRWLALLLHLGGKLRYGVDRVLTRYSEVGNPPVFDNSIFPWVSMLEENWQDICREARNVLENRDAIPPLEDISPDHSRLAQKRKWQSFFIWGYGYKLADNAAACPVTTGIVERIPAMNSAFFSIHAPGMHIPDHRGPTKALMTCHLGLIVPDERDGLCRMRVHDQDYQWEPGKALIFDDTYRHEVWNDTRDDRVILLIQFERPLRFPGSILARSFLWLLRISPFVQDARRNMQEWQKNNGGNP